MTDLTVYWITKDPESIAKIRQRFNIPKGITVNGETRCTIQELDLPLLRECESRGFIQIRHKK